MSDAHSHLSATAYDDPREVPDSSDHIGDPTADPADDYPDGPEDDAAADFEESYLDDSGPTLWDGDRGTLDGKQRDTLVMLLKKAFISSDDRAEWRTLVRDPGPIETSLNNLYFNLVLDTRSEVAYATPARTADQPFKTLVKDTANNREETLLLIYLRERFRAATAAGETHVFTDAIAMYDYVQRFRPASATDHSGDERKVANAIAGLVTSGLLDKTKDEGRYRIHRAIEALLPLTKLTHLLEAFRRLNHGTPETSDPRDPSSPRDPSDVDPDATWDTLGITGARGKHAAIDTSAADIAAEQAAANAERIDVQHDSDLTYDHTSEHA